MPLLPERRGALRIERARLEQARVEGRYRHLAAKVQRTRLGSKARARVLYELQCLLWLHRLLGEAIEGKKVPGLAPNTTSRHVQRAADVLALFTDKTSKDPIWLKPPQRPVRTTHPARHLSRASRQRAASAARRSARQAEPSTAAAA